MGETCIYEAVTNPYASTFVIKDNNDILVAQAFIWVDKEKDILVFDNIETRKNMDIRVFENILRKYVENSPYKEIHMGLGHNDVNHLGIIDRSVENAIFDGIVERGCYTDYKEDTWADIEEAKVILKKDGIVTFSDKELEVLKKESNDFSLEI